MTVVIGLCGPAGSGKTTASQYLVRAYGANSLALATPLKQILHNAFRVPSLALYGSQAEKSKPLEQVGCLTSRVAMQRLGDAIKDSMGANALVNAAWRKVCELEGLVVIEDIRYLHEAASIRAWPVTTHFLRLNPPPGTATWDNGHTSEAEWMKIPVNWELSPAGGQESIQQEIDTACAALNITPVLHSVEP